MKRRDFLKRIPAAAALPSMLSSQQQERPNIVFILTDDMGWADTEPFGVKDIKTPNIARLAREGTKFSNAYSNGAVCSPTRTAFLTGRYQQRFGIETALSKTYPEHLKLGVPDGEPTIASTLKKAGYATAVFGKWHVGFDKKFNPLNRGFDEFFGFLGGNFDMYSHKDRSGADDLLEGLNDVKKEGYGTDLFADRAVDFIERKAGQPFFLYVPFNAVHWPFQPPNRPNDVRDQKTWLDGTREDYKLMLEGLDAGIGKILSALDRKNLTKNTIVVFTNDNGGERLSNNGGLFHHKATLWEGGIRVPAIVRWPAGSIPAGKTFDDPVITMDFTASLLTAAGAAKPDIARLDGIDVFGAVRKGAKLPERDLFWRFDIPQIGRKQWAVRSGKYKLIRDGSNAQPSILASDLLFDLEKDPQEKHDLALENPKLVAELQLKIRKWEQRVAFPGEAPRSAL